jgi:hypothetical protein
LNNQNLQGPQRNNKCGFLGVSAHGSRWRAKIMAYGKHHLIGMFDTAEEAGAAYLKAKRELHARVSV